MPVAAVTIKKIKAPYDTVLIALGGHMTTKIWDYVEQMAVPAGAVYVRGASGYIAAETPGGAPEFYPPLYGQATGTAPVLKNHVRYTLSS